LKVLITSDIHGNFYALDSVLKQVSHDILICCGDMVIDFPYPEECITALRERNAHACIGNNDCFVADKLTPSQHVREPYLHYGAALDRAAALTQKLMSDASKAYLSGLSREHRFSVDGISFYMNHTGPGLPIYRYVHADTPLSELLQIYKNIQADVIVTGHTHIPYVKKLGDRMLINPGSVGESKDGDTRASFATFDTGTGQIELGKTGYDKSQTEQRLKKMNFPNYSLYCLKYGRWPENPDDDGS
jgi:putative phosphoesterase